MEHHDKPSMALAAGLSALAGFVDAIGFLHLGGFFVSFMSGNSTRLGVSLAEGDLGRAPVAAGLIGLFVLGVMLGSWTGTFAGRNRRAAVLALTAGLLTLAAVAHGLGRPWLGATAMVLAMGAENAVFQRNGEVAIGLTYMTGALVRMGQRLAATLTGGPRFAWAPYLLLWSGLCLGAVAGAASYRAVGPAALWGAAAVALALTAVAAAGQARRAGLEAA